MKVYDKELIGSNFCGQVSVPIDYLRKAPNTWAINLVLPLNDGKRNQGSIYLQGKFIPEGQQDDNSVPQEQPHPKK